MPHIEYLLIILFSPNNIDIHFCFTVMVFLDTKIRLSLSWIVFVLKLLKRETEEMVQKYGQMKVLVQGHSPGNSRAGNR